MAYQNDGTIYELNVHALKVNVIKLSTDDSELWMMVCVCFVQAIDCTGNQSAETSEINKSQHNTNTQTASYEIDVVVIVSENFTASS